MPPGKFPKGNPLSDCTWNYTWEQGRQLASMSNGTTTWDYTYDAWGRLISSSGTMASTLGTINPLRYRGYVYDPETKLYYLQSRYYDPELGRFINADDIGYLGAGASLTSFNLFNYCGNNPVMGYDPAGTWDWGWEEQAALGITVLIVGIALLLAAPTGGTSLAAGALMISASTVATAGSAMAITGTVIVGQAATAHYIESSRKGLSRKPTSQNQMQKQVESGKAPKEVDRVDKPHVNAPDQQNHVHFKDGTAINMDGSKSHESRGVPTLTKAIREWLEVNGWCISLIVGDNR